jgi:hypothetical protein
MNSDLSPVNITKQNGEKAPFNVQKLIDSLERAGASEEVIESIVHEVGKNLEEGISTHKVYRMAYALLRKLSKKAAGRYRLKKAIFELGPTGFPFERFVGELLKNQGYQVNVGTLVQGHCIQHEVDVVAEKENRKYMIECKFHSDPGTKSDVKVSLYIHSRFLDIERAWKNKAKSTDGFHQGWIVTNTRFTQDALDYGKCAGLKMISWDYPPQGSLKDRIDLSGLHPITALQTLTKKEKHQLLEKNLVLCRDLRAEHLKDIGIKPVKLKKILEEAEELSGIKNTVTF